jgi:hypothetical protein
MNGRLKVLKSSLLAVLLLASTAEAAPWLLDKDIAYVLVGREIKGHYRNGADFSETYRRTGQIEYKDSDGMQAGQWTLQGGQFCTTYEGSPGGCYRIRMHSGNCFEFWLVAEDGKTASEWIARGWQVKYQSTCPKGDQG